MSERLIETAESAALILDPENVLRQQSSVHTTIMSLMQEIKCLKDHQHTVTVLDMDGTLYPHDGPQNGFKGSSVERGMTQIHVDYILANEPELQEHEARNVFTQSLTHAIGPSMFFAERYGRSRAHTFDLIWGSLQPGELISAKAAAPVRQILGEVRVQTCSMILLTGAPRIWKDRVFQHLNIQDVPFDAVLTTEEFQSKDDVFKAIAAVRPKVRGFSVGDSESTDIIPAQQAGFHALHMNDHNTVKDIPHFLRSHHE